MGIYYSPESFGVECVGQVEWGTHNWFDLTAVWVDAEGHLYWADDAGCSCVTQFEDVESIEDLQSGTLHQLAEHLHERRPYSTEPSVDADVVELLSRADRMTGKQSNEGGR
jgi:hypothetical protein